ncbi:MAG: hypothetical protein HY695_30505 [Deltaproteobacteria bacterium]|nr:hypothetical protein [Deltaproteobacteria bacterium]
MTTPLETLLQAIEQPEIEAGRIAPLAEQEAEREREKRRRRTPLKDGDQREFRA